MIPIVILAGGASTRMGHPKGLMEFKSRTWSEVQFERIYPAGIKNILFVLGHHAELYEAQSPWAKIKTQCPDLNISVIKNPRPELGSFSSLQVGLGRLKICDKGVLVLPIDVPFLSPHSFSKLYEATLLANQSAHQTNGQIKAIVPECNGGGGALRGGHPVWLSRSLINKILNMNPSLDTSRLDFVIRNLNPSEVKRVAVEDFLITFNLNTSEDLTKLESFCF